MERTIRFDVMIRVPAREVWSALTDTHRIPRWWSGVRSAELTRPAPGGVYRLEFLDGRLGECEIIEHRLGELLRYRWKSSEPEPTYVEYALRERYGVTTLAFANTGYKDGRLWDKCYDASFAGWVQKMLSVRRLLETAHA